VVVFDLLVDTVVVAWLLLRQRSIRRVRANLNVPVLLSVFGVVQFFRFTQTHSLSVAQVVLVLGSLAVAGTALGVLRASTVQIWRAPGTLRVQGPLVSRGTWATVALLAASVGLHLAVGVGVVALGGPWGAAAGSLLLYLAVTMGVQRATVRHRALRMVAAGTDRLGTTIDARSWDQPLGR
jgi:hypothetical protein